MTRLGLTLLLAFLTVLLAVYSDAVYRYIVHGVGPS